MSSFLHAHGHDVFIVSMPLKGVNKGPGSNATYAQDDHWWFLPIERAGEPALRYFLEPAIATINYARRLGYEEVHMAGLSGGGWTTTVVAALDARVASSFPIAGSIPCAMRDPEKQTWPVGNDKEDFEQNCAPDPSIEAPDHPGRKLYRECNYTCMYLLAGLESTRYQVQILHERDDCCYATVGRHDQMLAYESNVRAELGARAEHGYFTTTASNHTHHEVAPVDKAIWAAGMRAAQLPPGDPGWDALQCDIMHNAEGACSVRRASSRGYHQLIFHTQRTLTDADDPVSHPPSAPRAAAAAKARCRLVTTPAGGHLVRNLRVNYEGTESLYLHTHRREPRARSTQRRALLPTSHFPPSYARASGRAPVRACWQVLTQQQRCAPRHA